MDPLRHSKDLTRPFNGPLSTVSVVGPLMTGMDIGWTLSGLILALPVLASALSILLHAFA